MRKCSICLRKQGTEKGEVKRMIKHHITYDPEVTVFLCYQCHLWWHGSGRVFKHPFVVDYGRGEGSNMFLVRAAQLVRKYTGSEV